MDQILAANQRKPSRPDLELFQSARGKHLCGLTEKSTHDKKNSTEVVSGIQQA